MSKTDKLIEPGDIASSSKLTPKKFGFTEIISPIMVDETVYPTGLVPCIIY
jgi:hypothetical protein